MATIKTVKVCATGPGSWLITTRGGKHTALADQPEAMGGKEEGPSPLDHVFISLASCLITIGKIVAGQR